MSNAFKKMVPLMNRILVKRQEVSKTTTSGLVLQSSNDKNHVGEVVEAGEGNMSANGVRMPMAVHKGDTVLLPEYGGSAVTLDNQELFVYRDSDVLGVLLKQ